MFRRQQTAVIEPEPTLDARIEQALDAVTRADERIAEIGKEIEALRRDYRLTLDLFGNIAYCELPDPAMRGDLERKVREIIRARSAALQDFYSALNLWAGLKGSAECHK